MKHDFKKGGTYYTLRIDVNPVHIIKCVVTSSGREYLKFTAQHDLSKSHKRNVELWLNAKYVDFDGKNLVDGRQRIYLNKDEAIKGAKAATSTKIFLEKQRIDREFAVEYEVIE